MPKNNFDPFGPIFGRTTEDEEEQSKKSAKSQPKPAQKKNPNK